MKKEDGKNYFTIGELVREGMQRAKADPRWGELIDEDVFFDYINVDHSVEKTLATRCSFDVAGETCYGSSEGVYGDISFDGIIAPGGGTIHPMKQHIHVATLKTLDASKEAYLAMHFNVGLICYHIMEVMRENMGRFD